VEALQLHTDESHDPGIHATGAYCLHPHGLAEERPA
jgi:hypothetical protein